MQKPLTIISICLSLIICVLIASYTYYIKNRSDDIISVAGMGKVDIKSDHVVWSPEIVVSDSSLQSAYAKIAAQKSLVSEFMKAEGVDSKEFTFQALAVAEIHNREFTNNNTYVDKVSFRLSQAFTIDSYDTDKIEKVYTNIGALTKDGLTLSSSQPIYFYSKLPELKLQLIALAAEDSKKRAETIASVSNVTLGKLRNSSTGVFQIYGQNVSPDPYWDGAYDTKYKLKTANITIKNQYEIK